MTSKPPATLHQAAGSDSKNYVRVTVTGLDSGGQLFRDNARVTFLKGQKLIYVSQCKPSSDGSVMIDLRIGGEAWHSDAKIRAVTPAGREPDHFRVTVELDRAHSAVIEASEDDEASRPAAPTPAGDLRSAVPEPADDAGRNRNANASSVPQEFAAPDLDAMPEPAPPPVPARKKQAAPSLDDDAGGEIFKPAPAPPAFSKAALTDIVRSVMASEMGPLKRELHDAIVDQVESALRQPFEAIEAKIEQHLQKPAITEEAVRKLAAQAAENTQIEWATASQDRVADAVRAAIASDAQQQRRELRMLVSGEMEAALRGHLAARIDARVDQAVSAKMNEHLRANPIVTEDTVRQLAAQVAESVQLRWVTTRLQKMVAEAVRSALASDSEKRRAETKNLISEIAAALPGLLADKVDAAVEKTLAARIDQYLRTPSALSALQRAITEVARHPLDAEDSIDALVTNLSDRLTRTDRAETQSPPQDIRSRIAATEQLTNQVVTDIQQKLNSFTAEMNRILGLQKTGPSSESGVAQEGQPSNEKPLRELLQVTGSNFEREIEAALQKAFGKLVT